MNRLGRTPRRRRAAAAGAAGTRDVASAAAASRSSRRSGGQGPPASRRSSASRPHSGRRRRVLVHFPARLNLARVSTCRGKALPRHLVALLFPTVDSPMVRGRLPRTSWTSRGGLFSTAVSRSSIWPARRVRRRRPCLRADGRHRLLRRRSLESSRCCLLYPGRRLRRPPPPPPPPSGLDAPPPPPPQLVRRTV